MGLFVAVASGASCSKERVYDDGGGQGGGAGGGPGGAPAVACTSDAACRDELACNGVEECVEGFCVAGENPCGEAAAGCVVTCEEDGDRASCEVHVLDEDEDGHVATDNECEADPDLPRDDCDDSEPDAYEGAEETCDGIDNDCDGLPDYKEGFELGGEEKLVYEGVAGAVPSIYSGAAWSSHHGNWTIVYVVGTSLWVALLEPNGDVALEPRVLVTETTNIASDPIAIVWEGDVLAVTYRMSGSGNPRKFARFRIDEESGEVEEQGTRTTIQGSTDAFNASLATAGENGFAVLFNKSSKAYVQRFTANGTAVAPLVDLGDAGWQDSIVGGDDGVHAIWMRFETDEADEAIGSAFLVKAFSGASLLTETDEDYLVAPNVEIQSDGTSAASRLSDGYFAMTRRRGGEVHLVRRSNAGNECGPLQLPGALRPVSTDGEVRMTANDHSAFYLTRDEANSGSPDRIRPLPLGCDANAEAGNLVTLDAGFMLNTGIYTLASSPGGHIVVLSNNGDLNVRVRAFGNAFCDEARAE